MQPARSSDSVGAECGVARQDFEVCVGVKNGHIGSNRNRRDQAVDQLPGRFTVATANPIERRCLLEVDGLSRQERGPSEQAPKVGKMPIITSTGEDLHPHRLANGDVRPEEFIHPKAGRAPGVSEKLDPRRGIDQNHETRLARSSPRSPSHPEPLNARASSTVSASAASSRNARLTASRFVDRW